MSRELNFKKRTPNHKRKCYRIGNTTYQKIVNTNRVNEKYIPVPEHILAEWKRILQHSDKIRIARTQNLIASELTLAFRGHATIETINKVNRYFEISRKDFKIKVA